MSLWQIRRNVLLPPQPLGLSDFHSRLLAGHCLQLSSFEWEVEEFKADNCDPPPCHSLRCAEMKRTLDICFDRRFGLQPNCEIVHMEFCKRPFITTKHFKSNFFPSFLNCIFVQRVFNLTALSICETVKGMNYRGFQWIYPKLITLLYSHHYFVNKIWMIFSIHLCIPITHRRLPRSELCKILNLKLLLLKNKLSANMNCEDVWKLTRPLEIGFQAVKWQFMKLLYGLCSMLLCKFHVIGIQFIDNPYPHV
jgi:hypothetical protein